MATEITIPPKPFTYADGTPAVAGQVNSNFDKVFDENFTVAGYTYFGWWRFGNGLEYNAANAFQSVSDVDLTTILQEGDKIRWFHDPTNTQKYGWVSHVDYDDTVANRSYVEVIGDTVLDETVELDSIGVSRIANPDGWPQDPDFGRIIQTKTTSTTIASDTFVEFSSDFRLNLPRGRWRIGYRGALLLVANTTTTEGEGLITFSTGTTSIVNPGGVNTLSQYRWRNSASSASNTIVGGSVYLEKCITLTSATLIYLIGRRNFSGMNVLIGSATTGSNFDTFAYPDYK